ncbi:MAG: AAA family ATPase [Xanthomonadales bacterium]|nr:AAA family ATPase [Xanthomonadales bacterium]
MFCLSNIKITNYRSCRSVELSLDEFNPIVGPNNAGKSNILSAITWFLAPSVLSESDFWDKSAGVSVEGTVTGLGRDILDRVASTHRSRIAPRIKHGSLCFRRTQPLPNARKGDITLEIFDPESGADNAGAWVPNPAGIDNALQALFPSPIFIGAMENAADDATKAKNTSTLGKLLAEFSESVESNHGQELQECLETLHGRLAANGCARASELTRFDQEASSAVNAFFPGIDLHLDVPIPTVRELFSRGTLRVSENGSDDCREFGTLGHGAQRSIQMALIRYLAEVGMLGQESAQRRLLLIEEPELFLHPQAIEQVREALRALSKLNYQIIFATHSPVMVDQEVATSTRIVRKHPSTGETVVLATAREAVEKRVQGQNKRLHALFALEHSNHWLFSNRVLLAEGPTERYLLPVLYQVLLGRKPAEDGLSILSMGGAGNLPESIKIFSELGVAVRALADLDFAAQQAVHHGLIAKDDEDLCECLRQIACMAQQDPAISLDATGRPCSNKENPAGSKRPAEVFREWAARAEGRKVAVNLHNKLREYGIWLWTGGDIEYHLGLRGRKDIGIWAPFCRRLHSEAFVDVVHDHYFVAALFEWMQQPHALP